MRHLTNISFDCCRVTVSPALQRFEKVTERVWGSVTGRQSPAPRSGPQRSLVF